MAGRLQEALREYQHFTSELIPLHSETSRWLNKIQTKLGLEDEKIEIAFPIAKLKEVENTLKKSPSAIFIGNHNCGKSSLLNELLRGTYLPVDETPCTSRIVRIKYSESNNLRLVSPDGGVLETMIDFRKKIPEEFVVLEEKEKEDNKKLGTIVEVGLKHDLLKSGIELIDCPGKNETPALDRVVDDFVKKGTVPLVIYVIDGDMTFRQTDIETVNFLWEKLPHVSFIFVCNKIDIPEQARAFDDTAQVPDKRVEVFAQLKRSCFIPKDAVIDSCQVFHGLSAKNIREARIERREDDFAKKFSWFRECFREVLAESIQRHVRLTIDGIISVLEQFILAIKAQDGDLAKVFHELLDDVLKTHRMVSDILRDNIIGNLVHEEAIKEVFVKVKQESLEDAEGYQMGEFNLKLHKQSVDFLLANLPRSQINPQEFREEITFFHHMASTIAGKLRVRLSAVLEKPLESLISGCAADLKRAMANIKVPSLKRALCHAYGLDSTKDEALPTEMLRVLKDAVFVCLITDDALTLTVKVDIVSLLRSAKPLMDTQWKERVVHMIMAGPQPNQLASDINEAYNMKLSKIAATAATSLVSIKALFGALLIESARNKELLEELRVLFLPQMMQLGIKAFSLRNEMDLGKVQLGDLIGSGETVQIYSCASFAWCEHGCVVRVLQKDRVGEDLWSRSAEALYLLKEYFDKQATPSPFLLRLHGWLMPEPGVLHVVVEKAKTDLLSAVQQGMTLKNRLHIARQVGLGLKSLHDAGGVCGDLKPQRILISQSGSAKINVAKPRDPFKRSKLGEPFHLPPNAYKDNGKFSVSNDIYAFGMLLWVLCDGTGSARPKTYDDHKTKAQMKIAVQQGIVPERPEESSDACWALMETCWKDCLKIKMDYVLEKLKRV